MWKLKIKKSPSYLNPTPYFKTLWVRGVGEMSMKSNYTLLSRDYVFFGHIRVYFPLEINIESNLT